jgi:hypothetical protein
MPPSKYLQLLSAMLVSATDRSIEHDAAEGGHPQLSVDIKSFIGLDFHLPDPLTGHNTLTVLDRGLKLVAPGTPPAISVPVIIAAKKVSACFRAFFHRQRYIDGLEEVFGQIGVQGDEVVDVPLDILGVEAAEKIAAR